MTNRTPDSRQVQAGAPALLTAREAAALIGMNERTVRRAIASGDLPAIKRHGAFGIERQALDAWRTQRVTIAAAVGEQLVRTPPRPFPELPRPFTPLIGRERETETACALLRRPEVRLVTFTGPGGVGKTHLALNVAAELRNDFPDDAWFVPLAHLSDPEHIPGAMLLAMGYMEPGRRSQRDALLAFLRERRILLVLDNFEHVIDAVTDLSEMLLLCPHLTLLVTTRTLLRVRGEYALPVPPLDLPEDIIGAGQDGDRQASAVRLFAARASAILPSFTLDAVTTPLVVDICRRLDGLPLAIELAAARINFLPLPALRDRLDQRLTVLTGGMRDSPSRNWTMRNSIAWSFDLLSEEERVVFRRLSVFAGGFTMMAAEAVTANAGGRAAVQADAVAEIIASLIDKSLLRRIDLPGRDPRFEMLETIRAYALEDLAACDDDANVRDRHAAWCLAFIERSPGGGWRHTPNELWMLLPAEAEQNNVRAALAWLEHSGDASGMLRLAVAIHSVWEVRGFYSEAVEWFERGLAIGGETALDIRLKAHASMGRKLGRQGRYALAREHHQSAQALARELGDDLATAQAVYALGGIETNQGHYDLALPLLTEALDLSSQLDDESGICGAHYFLGVVRLGQDNATAAIAHLETALGTRRTGRPFFNLSVLLNALGLVRCELGDIAGAALALVESRQAWDQGLGANRDILAEWLAVTARLALLRNNPDGAARLLGAAEALGETLGIPLLVPPPSQYQRLVSMLETRLGPQQFSAARTEGRAMSAEASTAEALPAPDVDASAPHHPPTNLSTREMDVLRLLATGLRDREIAEALFISVRTVEGHVAHILTKLDVPSRLAAVHAANALGLTHPDW